jgi:hypothetical protein
VSCKGPAKAAPAGTANALARSAETKARRIGYSDLLRVTHRERATLKVAAARPGPELNPKARLFGKFRRREFSRRRHLHIVHQIRVYFTSMAPGHG